MKSVQKILSVTGLCLSLTASSFAAAITGTLDMTAQVQLNTTVLSTATSAMATTGSVLVGDGAYASTAGSTVNFVAFGWNPSTVPVNNLWSFSDEGKDYSFNLATISSITQNSNFLNLVGSGTLFVTGFTPTAGSWTYTITSSSGVANADGKFTATPTNSSVPDGGSTAALLGLSLLGVVWFAKRKV